MAPQGIVVAKLGLAAIGLSDLVFIAAVSSGACARLRTHLWH